MTGTCQQEHLTLPLSRARLLACSPAKRAVVGMLLEIDRSCRAPHRMKACPCPARTALERHRGLQMPGSGRGFKQRAALGISRPCPMLEPAGPPFAPTFQATNGRALQRPCLKKRLLQPETMRRGLALGVAEGLLRAVPCLGLALQQAAKPSSDAQSPSTACPGTR